MDGPEHAVPCSNGRFQTPHRKMRVLSQSQAYAGLDPPFPPTDPQPGAQLETRRMPSASRSSCSRRRAATIS
jgi:hypothetical protein